MAWDRARGNAQTVRYKSCEAPGFASMNSDKGKIMTTYAANKYLKMKYDPNQKFEQLPLKKTQ